MTEQELDEIIYQKNLEWQERSRILWEDTQKEIEKRGAKTAFDKAMIAAEMLGRVYQKVRIECARRV